MVARARARSAFRIMNMSKFVWFVCINSHEASNERKMVFCVTPYIAFPEVIIFASYRSSGSSVTIVEYRSLPIVANVYFGRHTSIASMTI